jgi:hypothetical protein
VRTRRLELRGGHGIVGAGRHYTVEAGIRIQSQDGKPPPDSAEHGILLGISDIRRQQYAFGWQALLFPQDPIQARRPCADGKEVEKDKTVHHGQFAAIFNGPEGPVRMGVEIGDGHLATQNERNRPGEKTENEQGAA